MTNNEKIADEICSKIWGKSWAKKVGSNLVYESIALIIKALSAKDERIKELEELRNQPCMSPGHGDNLSGIVISYRGEIEELQSRVKELEEEVKDVRKLAGTMSNLRDKGEQDFDKLQSKLERYEANMKSCANQEAHWEALKEE